MLIIIEGPDGSGKSTLVKNLKKSFNLIPVKGIDRNLPNQYELFNVLMKSCANDTKDYVMDRSFITELIYRTILNDKKPCLTINEIIKLIDIDNVMYIFCENKESFTKSKQRGEDFITDECIHKELTYAYKLLCNIMKMFTRSSVITYDYEIDTLDKILNELQCKRIFA